MIKRLSLLTFLLLLATPCYSQKPRIDVNGAYLLKTAWGGSAPLNAFAPNGDMLGCHSVAFAQALYFHHLAPSGKVSYKCKNGTLISEDFSDYQPQWNTFALDKNSAKNMAAVKETARFIYSVASVVRKDFGTDQYVDYPNDYHKKAIETHFQCTLTPYPKEVVSGIGDALKAPPDFYSLLNTEINSGRPAGFYYTDRKGGGHAVIIDGYTVKEGKTYYHVNFGWLGSSDGWYLLEQDLPPNTKEMVLITIIPNRAESTKK